MKTDIQQTALKSITGVVLSILLFFSAGAEIPVLDSKADTYFKESITKAGVSYGVCRLINGTVSVIQESSLQLEPAGLGLSLAVGQVVDPINDMVERLSDVLVMSITSLGVQELAYEISITIVPQIIAVFLLLLSILLWIKSARIMRLKKILQNVIILVAIGRCCLPVSSLGNDFLQKTFFDQKIIEANEKLDASTADLEQVEEITVPQSDGLLSSLNNSASYLKEKSAGFKKSVQIFMENKAAIVENLLHLTFLYLGVFIIQVLFLPLLVFWLLTKIVNALFLSTTLTASGDE